MPYRIIALLIFVISVLTSLTAVAAPYHGDSFTFTQPDGTPFSVRLYGDNFFTVIETSDGYTLTKDPDTGFYYYAEPSDDGMSFQTTGYKAEMELPTGHGLNKKNRLLPAAVTQKSKAAREKFGVDNRGQLLQPLRLKMRPQDFGYSRWSESIETQAISLKSSSDSPLASPPSTTTTGTRVGLILLAEFPDHPEDVTITQAQVDAYANDPDYTDFNNATSVYGYFNIQSEGRLQYNCLVTAYFTTANPRSYYTDNSVAFGTRAKELINEGLETLKNNGFDFTDADANSDSVLDGVNLFYAGSRVNGWSEGLWPHKWSSSWSGLSGEGVSTSFQYQITDMGSSLTLGTFCHENGHMICNFPDLYSYSGNAANIGSFSLMHSSGTTHPVSVDAYLKMHAGWATIKDITSADHLNGALQVDKNTFYRYKNPARETEYFLLSMRTDSGYEGVYGGSTLSVNPANGLVVWHAYENGSNTYSSIVTVDSPADYSTPYELMVVEANPSSLTTPWYNDPAPGSDDAYHSDDVSAVSDDTAPALKFWNTSDGRITLSNLNIHTIGAQGETISFTVGAGAVVTPEIGLTATTLSPVCDLGTNADPQTISIFNAGGGTLNYSLSESLDWLSLSTTSGTTATEADLITLTYTTSGLEPDTYNGSITITDDGASNSPQTILLSLTVNDPPAIAIDKNELEVSIDSGSTTSASFILSNDGFGTLEYVLSASASWVSLDRVSGTVKAEKDEISVTFSATDLADGTYSAVITITDSSGVSEPATVTVTLNVSGNGSIIVLNPSGGNIFWQGSNHNISWRTNSDVAGTVDIALYKNGILNQTLVSDQANTGSYQWAIPADQTIGSDYRIRIISSDSSSITGESPSDFEISAMPSLTTIPYSEGFESDIGSWEQSGDDDFNWTRDSSGTPSSSTGPASAHSGSFYIYTEASSPNNPLKLALLENSFDLQTASAPVLSFAYHMYGSTMGTLTVTAGTDQNQWSTLFSKTGDQGNSWHTVNADLSQFEGQAVSIRITGTTGSSWASDMAIDAVSISESSKKLTASTDIFSESSSGGGAISNSITFTLTGDTYASDVITGGYVTAANVPTGLSAAFVRDSNTQITVSLTGNAGEHANKDSVFDLQIQFADGAFSSGDASDISGSTKNLIIDYFDAAYHLSVSRAGIGSGFVTSSSAGINCGSDCSKTYLDGSVVTLSATPSDLYSWFSEWAGDCSGAGDCVVTLTADTSVTALFAAEDRDNDDTPDHLDAFPDNPAYSDDGDNDGLPTAWEILYGLNTSLNDSGLDPDEDDLTNMDEFTMGTNPGAVTNGPGIAVLISPESAAAEQSLITVLETDYTVTADTDTHLQTLWEISKNTEFTTIVFRATSSVFKTQLTVPHGILDAGETVYWRVRYIDTENIAWPWSNYRSYATAISLSPDMNYNGLPDSMEIPADSSIDLDQNDIPDLLQSEMHCIYLSDELGEICLKDGENFLITDTFSWMGTEILDRIGGLQEWLLNFRILTDTPGTTVSLNVFFSKPLPVNTSWYKYDSINGWQDFSDHSTISHDRLSLTIELTDGGEGDADGLVNGIIVDPSGPVVTYPSGGGCFIKIVMDKEG